MQEDRSWAVGLNQEDFAKEFVKRFPRFDVIPDVNIWTANVHKYEYHGIDGINPENLQNDSPPDKDEQKQEKINKDFECMGCGKKFKHKIALHGHMRHCKALLHVRT